MNVTGYTECYKPTPGLESLSCAGEGDVESCRSAAFWVFYAHPHPRAAGADVSSRHGSLGIAGNDQLDSFCLVGSWGISEGVSEGVQVLATCDDDMSVLPGKVEQKGRCAWVNRWSGWGLGSSGGLDKRVQPDCLFAPGLWQLCEVTMGVRLFSLFNRGLQDPVGSQVEMDFGVLL